MLRWAQRDRCMQSDPCCAKKNSGASPTSLVFVFRAGALGVGELRV